MLLALVLALSAASTAALGQGNQPGDTGGTDEVTFYGHVFGHGLDQPMPANTEAPIGEDNYGIGTGAYCQDAGPTVPSAPVVGTPLVGDMEPCNEEEGNKLALFSTAGLVDVETRSEFQAEGAYGQLHNERGQTKPIQLDTGEPITASVYISMDAHGWFVGTGETNCLHPHPENVPCVYPYWGWDPGVYEDVVVEATLYSADLGSRTNASEAPPIHETYDAGEATEIATGQWGPGQVINGLPGYPNVNQFEIDLGSAQEDTIPRDEDFFLIYDVYQSTGGVNYLVDGPARWYGGEFFPPTFTLPVENAFSVERVVPNFAHGQLAILGIINTPWGSYDVDDDSVELEIEDPNGQTVDPDELTRFADFSVAHGGHFKPVNLTWIWDYQDSGLATGNYSVSVSASNFQGSASAACETWFTLERDDAGRLAPGEAGEGVCGIQTVGEDDLEDLQGGANQTAES